MERAHLPLVRGVGGCGTRRTWPGAWHLRPFLLFCVSSRDLALTFLSLDFQLSVLIVIDRGGSRILDFLFSVKPLLTLVEQQNIGFISRLLVYPVSVSATAFLALSATVKDSQTVFGVI